MLLKLQQEVAASKERESTAAENEALLLKLQQEVAALKEQENTAAENEALLLKLQQEVAASKERESTAAENEALLLKLQQEVAALKEQENTAAENEALLLKLQQEVAASKERESTAAENEALLLKLQQEAAASKEGNEAVPETQLMELVQEKMKLGMELAQEKKKLAMELEEEKNKLRMVMAQEKLKLETELAEGKANNEHNGNDTFSIQKLEDECARLQRALDTEREEHEGEKSEAKKKVQSLLASQKYYEEKLIKLNNERVEQLKQTTTIRENYMKLNQEFEKIKCEQNRLGVGKAESVEMKNWESSDQSISGERTLEPGIELDSDDLETKYEELQESNKLMKDRHAGEKEMLLYEICNKQDRIESQEIQMEVLKSQMKILEIRLKENRELQSLLDRRIHQRKISEELKHRFLLRKEMLEKELLELTTDLRYEKEQMRRLSFRDELKERFVLMCEKLQHEISAMKNVQDALVDEKSMILAELQSNEQRYSEYQSYAAQVWSLADLAIKYAIASILEMSHSRLS